MPQLIYSAKTHEGSSISGLVDAGSAEGAIAQLRAAGMTDIELQDDPSVAAYREDRAGLSEEEGARLAEFELRIRKNPGLLTTLAEVWRRRWFWLVSNVVVAAWGISTQNPTPAVISSLLIALTFGLPVWGYMRASCYNRMLKAYAIGKWEEVQQLLPKLRQMNQSEIFLFDLDIREGQMNTKQKGLQQVLIGLEKWRPRLESRSPGLFEARIASIHHAAGDYKGFLEAMRKAHKVLSSDPFKQLDLALAEARFGDVSAAKELVNAANFEAIPTHGKPFVHWTNGLIALRSNEKLAQQHLAQAVSGFLEFNANPAVWTGLALCSGAYALALARDGNHAKAKSVLEKVWPVLTAHGDKPLISMLKYEMKTAF